MARHNVGYRVAIAIYLAALLPHIVSSYDLQFLRVALRSEIMFTTCYILYSIDFMLEWFLLFPKCAFIF